MQTKIRHRIFKTNKNSAPNFKTNRKTIRCRILVMPQTEQKNIENVLIVVNTIAKQNSAVLCGQNSAPNFDKKSKFHEIRQTNSACRLFPFLGECVQFFADKIRHRICGQNSAPNLRTKFGTEF